MKEMQPLLPRVRFLPFGPSKEKGLDPLLPSSSGTREKRDRTFFVEQKEEQVLFQGLFEVVVFTGKRIVAPPSLFPGMV